MELSVTQEKLAHALGSVSRVAGSKTQLPILNNILLRTDGTRLLVAATNLEIAETHHIGAKITKGGSITVPSRLITDFISNLPHGPVELKVTNDKLSIKSGRYTSVINGVIADDFPELPTIDEKSSIKYSLTTDDFKQAVNQTIVAASGDVTRPVLTGVFWHSFEGFLYLVATDGYRLAERRLVETNSELSAIIPSQALQEALRTLVDTVDEIEILFDETQVRLRIGDAEIISRLIDGNFPDYRQLIPSKTTSNAEIKKEDLVRINKISGLFARESGGGVTIRLDKSAGVISIHSIASEVGENTSEAEAKISEDGVVTLNSRYITDALGVTSGDKVSVGFSGKLAPVVLRVSEKDPNYTHIIMPLKS